MNSRRRHEASRFRREPTTALNPTYTARAFYCGALQGRQVWDADRDAGLSFIVEGTRIDVGTGAAAGREPVVLAVLNPDAVAERCWDAGYRVQIGDEATADAAVSVIDPFGRRIDLVR